MAYVGLANPYVAKLKSTTTSGAVTTPVYEAGFICGKAVSLNITPNYNEASLYADNILDEYVKDFKDGTITLGVDRLPSQAVTTMFGHTVGEDSEIKFNTNDSANYVGVGFYVDELIDGAKKYTAMVLYKTKFTESADDYTTKGDSIEFKTPSLEGKIAALDDGQWKATKSFDTIAEAQAWITAQFPTA